MTLQIVTIDVEFPTNKLEFSHAMMKMSTLYISTILFIFWNHHMDTIGKKKILRMFINIRNTHKYPWISWYLWKYPLNVKHAWNFFFLGKKSNSWLIFLFFFFFFVKWKVITSFILRLIISFLTYFTVYIH